jgi:tight adherence protein B
MSGDVALGEWGRRLADPVGDRIVEVLRMAHEVGGTDLPDVLNSLQRSVRADIAVRGDATAKQSWIRSAAVMALAAPWVVLVVIASRGDTVASYQSVEGSVVLLVGAVVSGIAYRMMRSIGSLPAQRRWVG